MVFTPSQFLRQYRRIILIYYTAKRRKNKQIISTKSLNIGVRIENDLLRLDIENLDLFGKYIMGGKSNKLMDEKLNHRQTKEVVVDTVISEEKININNKEFEIYNFNGHTPGSIGILTEDKVLFVGDLLVGEDMLKKYDFLFLFDIEEQLKSLDKIKNIDFEYLVISHSKKLISKEESVQIIENHKNAINKYVNQVRMCLSNPITVENILKNIILFLV